MNPLRRLHLIVLLLMSCGCSAISGGSADADLEPQDKTIYSIGWNLGQQLRDYHFTAEEAELVASGLQDAIGGKPPRTKLGSFEPHALRLEAVRMAAAAAPERHASEGFVAAEAKRLGIDPSSSGLVFEQLQSGTGATPTRTGTVTVAYEIRRRDGVLVESSGERPATFLLSSPGTLPCIREALLRMRVGSRVRLVCPPRLAYGDRRHGSLIPAGAALVVDAELLGVGTPLPGSGH